MDDPDASVELAPPHGIWDHWIIYNIPASITQLQEGEVNDDIKVLNNGWKEKKYRGPCPPAGKPHRYFFKLYALNDYLELEEDASAGFSTSSAEATFRAGRAIVFTRRKWVSNRHCEEFTK